MSKKIIRKEKVKAGESAESLWNNADLLKKIRPASEYPFECITTQDRLIGYNNTFIDSVVSDDTFEDRMISILDNGPAQVEKEETFMDYQLRSYATITDTRIMDIIDNVRSLDKDYVATTIFFHLFNKLKSKHLSAELIIFLNARFFPPSGSGLTSPVTYRDMGPLTGKSVRTNFIRTAEGIEIIKSVVSAEFPLFYRYLTACRAGSILTQTLTS